MTPDERREYRNDHDGDDGGKISALDIKIDPERWAIMTAQERSEFIDKIFDSMTPEQQAQMARIGLRVVRDDVLCRANQSPRYALRTMARAVNVTVNEVKDGTR